MTNFNNYMLKLPIPPSFPHPPLKVKDLNQWEIKLNIYNKDLLAYKEKIIEYRTKQNQLVQQFKIDLLKELGLENHPKANIIFELAEEITCAIHRINDDSCSHDDDYCCYFKNDFYYYITKLTNKLT